MENKKFIYDDESINTMEKIETGQLISALIRNIHSLQSMVIDLREEVNDLNPDKPYFDLHSDLYNSFEDYVALKRLSEYIDSELVDVDNE